MQYLSRRNIRAASLAMLLFVYPIITLSFFSVKYIETIHRITVFQIFDVSLFGSLQADSLAAVGFGMLFLGISSRLLVSKAVFIAMFSAAASAFVLGRQELVIGALMVLPAIAVLLTSAAIADRRRPLTDFSSRFPLDGKRVAGAFLLIVIVIEAGALARWIAYPLYPSEIYGDASWKFAEIESALFHSLGLLSPVLVALLAFSFLYRWFIVKGLRRIGQTIAPTRAESASAKQVKPRFESKPAEKTASTVHSESASLVMEYAKSTNLTSKHLHRGLLALALAVAPLLMIYPHLPMINPGGEGVSTDEVYYMNWMSILRAGSDGTWTSAVSHAFTINNGDRPLSLLVIYAIASATGLADLTIIRFLPVALAPILVAANYFLLRYTLDSKQYGINRVKVFASIGAVLAIFSPQIVVGEYAGLLANWMALTIAYFAFYLMVRVWESKERNRMVVSVGALFAILILTMLVHLYTWAHLLAVIVVFTGLSYLLARKSVANPGLKVVLMLALVASTFAIDYTRSMYLGTASATESESALASNIHANDPSTRWDRLYFTLSTFVGGFLSTPALFLLALVWVVRTKPGGLSILMLSMIFMISVPVAVGSIEFQTRVLYNTPMHIAALLALMWTGGALGRRSDDKALQKLLIIGIIFAMATFALRAMANLPLELPSDYQLESTFLLA